MLHIFSSKGTERKAGMAVYFWTVARREPVQPPWGLRSFCPTGQENSTCSFWHTIIYSQFSKQFTEVSIIIFGSPPTNWNWKMGNAFLRFTNFKHAPPQALFTSRSVRLPQCCRDQIHLPVFGFCNILQNSSSLCKYFCIYIYIYILNVVRRCHILQMLPKLGKNTALE